MNTETIAYGWAVTPGTELMELVSLLRATLEPVHRALVIEQIAVHAALAIDEADAAGVPRRGAAMFDALARFTAYEDELASGLANGASPVMSLSFDTDPETDQLYVWGHMHFAQYVRAIDELGVGEYWPHWNESAERAERPYGVSSKQWNLRGEVWERVLRAVPAAEVAGRITLAIGSHIPDPSLLTEPQSIFDALPDEEQRARHWVSRMPGRPVPPDLSAFHARLHEQSAAARAALKPITFHDIAGAAS